VSPAKTAAEPIDMPFMGRLTRVGHRNHALDGVEIVYWKGQFLGLSGAFKKHCKSPLRTPQQKNH